MPPSPAAVRAMFRAFLRTGTSQRVAWDREQETGKNETGEKRERGREKRLQIELFDHDGGRLSLENGGGQAHQYTLACPLNLTPPLSPQAPTSPTTTSASTSAAAPGSASARQRQRPKRRRRRRRQQEREQRARPRTSCSRLASRSSRPRGGRPSSRGCTTGRSGR